MAFLNLLQAIYGFTVAQLLLGENHRFFNHLMARSRPAQDPFLQNNLKTHVKIKYVNYAH